MLNSTDSKHIQMNHFSIVVCVWCVFVCIPLHLYVSRSIIHHPLLCSQFRLSMKFHDVKLHLVYFGYKTLNQYTATYDTKFVTGV